jgi:hypothetical protein
MNRPNELRRLVRSVRAELDIRSTDRTGGDRRTTRRELLASATGAGLGLGLVRALDNVFLGYGRLMGTNLRDQDLSSYASERLEPHATTMELTDGTVELDGERLTVHQDGTSLLDADLASVSRSEAQAADDRVAGNDTPVTQLVRDLGALDAGRLDYEFDTIDSFFERLDGAATRPYTVQALRDSRSVDPSLVESFAGVDPRDSQQLLYGLVEGFREHSSYDIPRYAAGSVEDNVLLGRVDLRTHFESPTTYRALVEDENSGLFCSELTYRAIDGFHAPPAREQTPPVLGAYVHDDRHKHAYLGLASVFRESGTLTLGMTFVDYMHSTLYDDLRLTSVLGEGIEAYGDRHRTTDIYWAV